LEVCDWLIKLDVYCALYATAVNMLLDLHWKNVVTLIVLCVKE